MPSMQVPPFLQGLLSQSLISEKERKRLVNKGPGKPGTVHRPPAEETDTLNGSKTLNSIRTASQMHRALLSTVPVI